MAAFLVARNPSPQSRLPYLLCLPLPGDDLWLKAAATWPRATRVYCHPVQHPPTDVEELERVEALVCERRGNAIDLVLKRGAHRRSQFVFVQYRGREVILWQSTSAARSARPNARIPYGRARGDCLFLIDTRERYGYRFAEHGVTPQRRALPVGDYALMVGAATICVIERKTAVDFTTTLINGSLNLEMSELASLPHAAVVVEGSYSQLLRHQYSRPGLVPRLVSLLEIRYPSVPIKFLESRKIAEEWTFQFFSAAAHGTDPPLPLI